MRALQFHHINATNLKNTSIEISSAVRLNWLCATAAWLRSEIFGLIGSGLAAIMFLMASIAGQAIAQNVLAPPPVDFSGLPTSLQTAGTNQAGILPPLATPSPALQPLAEWGPIQLRPHLLYRLIYGDGIPATPGQQYKTMINEIYPGLLLQLGNHWNLDYTPILRFYSNQHFSDTVDNAVNLSGGTIYEDWLLGFSQTYASSSQPLVETGTQTAEEKYGTAVNGTYQMSSELSLELGIYQNFRFLEQNEANQQLSDSQTWSTMNWFNYQLSPHFGAAVGAGLGYDHVTPGSDMAFEQLQGRITWRPGDKLNLILSGGAEDRQFLQSSLPNAINPLFGLSARYQLFEPTTFSLGVSRTVGVSYFRDQFTEDFTVYAGLRQRLLKKLYLDLNGGYRKTSYSATTTGIDVNRDDSGTFFNARLSVEVLKRGTLALFFQESDNSSNEAAFDYSSTQGGLELGYRF